MPITGTPGLPLPLSSEFFDETSGLLTDATTITLDITYGTEVGLVADYAGPFAYDGASVPTPNQVYRTGTGSYSFVWQVPLSAASGVYVANWSFTYAGSNFLGIENFTVTGGQVPVASAVAPLVDLGYWTGGISYNGLDIEFGQVDSDGIAWLWQKLEGWDGPDVTGGLLQRAADHGAWPSPQFYQPRTLTWTVMATAPTQAQRDLARAKLSQAIPVSELAVLRYDEPIPKQAQVRRSGKITETYPTLTDVSFNIGLVAPDPRKYSTAVKVVTTTVSTASSGFTFPVTFPVTIPAGQPPGTGVTVTNAGNFETRPVVAVRGPVTAPALVNTSTGQSVSFSALTLTSNDLLAVDFSIQQAFLNGTYRPADPASVWWNLAPGTTVIALQATTNPGATLEAVFQDAFI
jgi:Phage tail protein